MWHSLYNYAHIWVLKKGANLWDLCVKTHKKVCAQHWLFMGLDVESFIGMTRKLWKKFETQTLYYGYVWISKKVCSYGNIQFCKGTTSPSCYFWPQDMIPSCGLHTSIDKRNLPSGMTLAKKPAEFRGKRSKMPNSYWETTFNNILH